MPTMSVPVQQKPNGKRTGKRITFFAEQAVGMKETSQHSEGPYYVTAGTPADPGQSEAASTVTSNPEGPHMYLSSVIFSPDKGDQNRGHYQQTVPMKWAHQEPAQQQRAAPWPAVPNWGQSFANYLGGLNVPDTRTQNTFAKSMHETRATDKVDGYRDAAKPAALEWEQQQQPPPPSQSFQETLKPGALNTQAQGGSHPGGSSVLQPFQLAFGQPKQHLPAYFQTFQSTRSALPNPPNYPSQSAAPSHHLEQQQQIIQQQIQHHQQMQQQQLMQQQQQQLQHEQQQQQQQKLQQQQRQLQIQQQMQHQQLQQQNPHVLDYYAGAQNAHAPPPQQQQPAALHSQEHPVPPPLDTQEPIIQDITPEPQLQQHADLPHLSPQAELTEPHHPRTSRRLSREGGAPFDNPFLPTASEEQSDSQNGGRDVQAAPTGVIQSTRGKRRVSQEVNLELLAQEASDRKSPFQDEDPRRPWSPPGADGMDTGRHRDDSLVPLVIPVSVPVRRREHSSPGRDEAALASSWAHRAVHPQDPGRPNHKPSVIVTRRRSLRNSLSESSDQADGLDGERDDDGKKSKRRPRPEPLFIPPPKLGLFIAPPVYSSITPYQSHLRSPVRLGDNPVSIPPYTPPPILSPVREGSGLYFATFLSSAAASAAGLPPPATPKSASRSLLRSNSCDITPPVLSAMSEATPVSIEPRINIGSRYQAEVPELRPRSATELDQHRAELVWAPLGESEEKPDYKQKVEHFMRLACSSAVFGGGTNQELAHHCLHECKGDVMAALSMLMLKSPIFPKSHHLSRYHYSGSDSWTAAERRQFNKGIAAYKKDFFMVQKQVATKTVAQCVEYYYSYKKHVKVGRSGVLLYGQSGSAESKSTEEEQDVKGSHRLETQQEEDSRKWEGSADRKQDVCPARVTHALQSTDNSATVLIMKSLEDVGKERPLSRVIHPPPARTKPRHDGTPRKTNSAAANQGAAAAAAPALPEGEFPCKKCGRVFYKVKSRSAHMKSHAEQEKKAALRQREAEERAAEEERMAAEERAAVEAAAFLAAQHQNGKQRPPGSDDSSTGEADEDWLSQQSRGH